MGIGRLGNLPSRQKLQKKQCGGVYFWLYGIVYQMPIQQKLPPPVLFFIDFDGWVEPDLVLLQKTYALEIKKT